MRGCCIYHSKATALFVNRCHFLLNILPLIVIGCLAATSDKLVAQRFVCYQALYGRYTGCYITLLVEEAVLTILEVLDITAIGHHHREATSCHHLEWWIGEALEDACFDENVTASVYFADLLGRNAIVECIDAVPVLGLFAVR